MDEVKKREALPDILKGFAVFLVILGHCIQVGSGADFQEETLFFVDKLYHFIYSFHMPLFMLVSGYFAWNSMKRGTKESERWRLLKEKAAALLGPVLAWTVVEMLWRFAEYGQEISDFSSPVAFLKAFALEFVSAGWFLWAVFWSFLIVYIVHFFFRDSLLVYIAGFLVMFIIPDGLNLGVYKFMLPYFIVAFYFHRYQEKYPRWSEQFSRVSDWVWVGASGAVFGILFLFFDENSMIYLSGYKLIGKDIVWQLGIDFYRTVIGFAGAIFFILFWRKLVSLGGKDSFPLLRALGVNSMGLYLVSGKICIVAEQRLRDVLYPSYLLNLGEAATVTALAYLLTFAFKRIPVLHWLVGRKEMGSIRKQQEQHEDVMQ